jgi:signal transduction histidine kinase
MVILEDKFSLDELFTNLLAEFQNEISGKGKAVDLIYTPESELEQGYIMADKKRLHQILSHLIANALRFTEEGHINFGFKIKDNRFIEIFVKDSGIGIERSKFEMIFDRFRQVDESASRQQGGSGLGLSISKELANLMGGRIYLESTIGKGSTFYVELPYLSAD